MRITDSELTLLFLWDEKKLLTDDYIVMEITEAKKQSKQKAKITEKKETFLISLPSTKLEIVVYI